VCAEMTMMMIIHSSVSNDSGPQSKKASQRAANLLVGELQGGPSAASRRDAQTHKRTHRHTETELEAHSDA